MQIFFLDNFYYIVSCQFFTGSIKCYDIVELASVAWHLISYCSKEGGPQGKTEILFTIPELKKKKNYHHNVHHGDKDICKTLYNRGNQTRRAVCLNLLPCLIWEVLTVEWNWWMMKLLLIFIYLSYNLLIECYNISIHLYIIYVYVFNVFNFLTL
jgi:hypothetical protein